MSLCTEGNMCTEALLLLFEDPCLRCVRKGDQWRHEDVISPLSLEPELPREISIDRWKIKAVKENPLILNRGDLCGVCFFISTAASGHFTSLL